MLNELSGEPEEYIEETFEEVTLRYDRYAKDLYKIIKEELPFVFDNLKFYKGKTYQLEDSYATYDDKKIKFRIQLDPDCEVICLSNGKIRTEIGNWDENYDYYAGAIEFIKTEFLEQK